MATVILCTSNSLANAPPWGRGFYGWALRQGAYKFVNPECAPPQLYTLEDEPFEQNDLLAGGGDGEMQAISARPSAKHAALIASGV